MGRRRRPASSTSSRAVEDGYGFLDRGRRSTRPALVGLGAAAGRPRRQHKEMMEKVRCGATFIGLLRDRGHGRVDVDAERPGRRLLRRSPTSSTCATRTRAIDAQARLHAAAGRARDPAAGRRHCRRGARATTSRRSSSAGSACRCAAGGFRLFSAHQMGTCRMGNDPQTSVAGPWGELHDTKGVWIGDGSAFPTRLGHEPDDLDHGARAPHRRGDRGRALDRSDAAAAGPANQSPRARRRSPTWQ